MPSDIERHLLLNKGRLTTYAQMKSEIDLVIESSLGSKAPISRPGAASSSDSGPAPMDVDSLTKVINSLVKGKGSGGKGKSKGKGKDKGSGGKGSTSKDIVCFNCGKAGHKAAECWSKKEDGSNKGSSKGSKGGGKKGKSKGKHKGANSLEEDTGEGAHEEEQPEGELDVGMFELGALTAGEDLQAMEWVRFNLDTGAAQTAIPSDWAGKVPVKEGTEVMFKTASGELVRGTGTGVFKGTGEFGHCCSVTGPLAPVHKPLVSAYKCLKHGRVAVLDEHGGNLIPQDSKVSGKILELIEEQAPCEGMDSGVPGEGCLQLLPEGEGTYSGFWAAAHSGVSPAQAMAAPDEEMRTWEHLRADLRVFLREKRRVRRLRRLRWCTSEPNKGGGGRA